MAQGVAVVRFRFIQMVILLAALVLILRLFYLQVLDTTYSDRARTTAVHKYIKYPSRGLIYDRNANLLVNNEPVYDLMVTYKQVSPEMDTSFFCTLLEIDKAEFLRRMEKDWSSRQYSKSVPFVFMSKLPPTIFARFQESLYEFPGFYVQGRNIRTYPHSSAAHTLGYISEVTQNQIDAFPGIYSLGDYIGANGLEYAYEEVLRGKKGVNYVLKDNLGRVVDKYKDGALDSAATSGTDLITTLDLELQAYAEELLKNKNGSIVAIEPATGEILTMASSPAYDPNLLSLGRNRGTAFAALNQDSLRPFFNRSVMAKYPPGSLFKTVVALVALQEGEIVQNQYFPCEMGYYYGSRLYGCHEHTPIYSVAAAIQHSCNAFFFRTLRKLIDKYGFENASQGLDSLNNYLYRFGLGSPLGIDFPQENAGNIPTPAYYDKLYPKNKGSWRSPTIMSIGIGQGEIELTTMQMANLAAIMANRGYYFTPHLIKGFGNGAPIQEEFRKPIHTGVDSAHFIPVIEGMARAVTGGTGYTAYIPDIPICAKTGTSQNPHGKDHSVFFAFAPRENPQIAVAVYVEKGGWGTTYAAPIASLIIEKYIRGEISKGRQFWDERMRTANLVDNP